LDFKDLVTTVAPPPNRVGKSDGPDEHHLFAGAVMLAYALMRRRVLTVREIGLRLPLLTHDFMC